MDKNKNTQNQEDNKPNHEDTGKEKDVDKFNPLSFTDEDIPKDKDEDKDKGEGEGKDKGEDKGEGKSEGKGEGEGEGEDKGKDEGEDKDKDEGKSEEEKQLSDWIFEAEKDEEDKDKNKDKDNPQSGQEIDFIKTIAKDLGIEDEINTKEELITKLKKTKEKEEQENIFVDEDLKRVNDWIKETGLSFKDYVNYSKGEFKNLGDEELVKMTMKNQGFSDEKIEKYVKIYKENDTLELKADEIRIDQDKRVKRDLEEIKLQKQKEEKTKNETYNNQKKELKNILQKTESMFGGKINDQVRTKLYNYITAPDGFFAKLNSHDAIIKHAFMDVFEKQINKMLEGRDKFNEGMERGKASILNDLQNPNFNRKTYKSSELKKGFDINKFIESNERM